VTHADAVPREASTAELTRRALLGGLGAAAALACARGGSRPVREPAGPLIDFHVHLFGVGDGGTGCHLSAGQRRHVNYRYLLALLGLADNGRMDRDYADALVLQLRASAVTKAVLLAQDCRYDASGRPDLARTSFFVPNDYLFEVARREPDLFIPCVSVNPRRRDALDELTRCAALGARILKIHPPTQDVDPGERRFAGFYRKCAELGVIVMVHTGTEHAAAVVGHEFSDPARLVLPLEEGCTVVAAHAGMGSFFDREDFFPNLVAMVAKYPRLYCDTAILASTLRWRNVPRLLASPEVLARTLHASDFPFPSNALVFWNRLAPATLLALLSERNLFERDWRLKQALGMPPEVFERAAQLLA
jgi:predicted TIM-barrel fold metal-dependent hydrolase